MHRIVTALGMGLLLASTAAAAPDIAAIRDWRQTSEHALLAEYLPLLALPNVASDREAIRRVAGALVTMLEKRGLAPRLLELDDPDVPPLVLGEWTVPGASETLVFYAHYDGQPVTPEEWDSDPWVPVLRDPRDGRVIDLATLDEGATIDRDWRLYARSASDDKAGVIAILWAIDALRATGQQPLVNVRVLFEGEEEAGSPHLAALLERHRDVLGDHPWIIVDGPRHQSGRMQVAFGVRGDANAELTTYGALRGLHSGHYGNWAPNPALLMAQLLASMKDADGRILIAGWHADALPLGNAERTALAAAPDAGPQLLHELGLARTEHPQLNLLEAISRASLNINGMRSGAVGDEAANVIPNTAQATLDLRLVLGETPEGQFAKLQAHARGQGFHVLDREPTDAERRSHPRIVRLNLVPGAYAASRTPMDHPLARRVVAALSPLAPEPPVLLPTMGGSLPLVVINKVLGAPTLIVPIANHDNNQHAQNENLRLGNLWDGIEMLAAVMRQGAAGTTH